MLRCVVISEINHPFLIQVTVITTGHEKMRVTVCLTARADGKKLPTYVLVKNKRPVQMLQERFKGRLVINWAGSTWMNDATMEDYLRKIIKGGNLFSGRRLLVWDAFASHKSNSTTAVLKDLKLDTALIPGGCTASFRWVILVWCGCPVQAPDVSWNKPFKEHVHHYYSLAMASRNGWT